MDQHQQGCKLIVLPLNRERVHIAQNKVASYPPHAYNVQQEPSIFIRTNRFSQYYLESDVMHSLDVQGHSLNKPTKNSTPAAKNQVRAQQAISHYDSIAYPMIQ